MKYAYPCELTPEADGGFSVQFPDVPEALTCGETYSHALEMAEDALACALSVYVEKRLDLPQPGSLAESETHHILVPLQPVTAAKLALYQEMRRQNLTKVALAARLGVSEATVRKLINPYHRSLMGQVTRALRVLDRQLLIEDIAASCK